MPDHPTLADLKSEEARRDRDDAERRKNYEMGKQSAVNICRLEDMSTRIVTVLIIGGVAGYFALKWLGWIY